MNLVTEKGRCCGCRVCELVCPRKAIKMKEDEQGFLYPVVNERKCINCGLCQKKCAFQSGYVKRKEFEPFYGYAARHKDPEVLMRSRSGGAFTAISDVILGMGGSVYGAGYDREKYSFSVIHKKAETAGQRNRLRSSKYVQSDLNSVFLDIKQELEEGKQVLFTGVGCQVGALHKYLGKEYDNLLTVDIICHGVASPKLWLDFLEMRELECDGEITQVSFRDKRHFGWRRTGESIWFEQKKYSTRLFSKIYGRDIADRPSCYQCKYTNTDRPGDITIGDFWGIENALPEFATDNNGVSLVLVNTSKGKSIWESASEAMDYKETTGYPYRHTAMKFPTKPSPNYDEFWKDYAEQGFLYIMEKYLEYVPEYPDEKELQERKQRREKRIASYKRKRMKQNVKKKIKGLVKGL